LDKLTVFYATLEMLIVQLKLGLPKHTAQVSMVRKSGTFLTTPLILYAPHGVKVSEEYGKFPTQLIPFLYQAYAILFR
jgi:hypothetical protein